MDILDRASASSTAYEIPLKTWLRTKRSDLSSRSTRIRTLWLGRCSDPILQIHETATATRAIFKPCVMFQFHRPCKSSFNPAAALPTPPNSDLKKPARGSAVHQKRYCLRHMTLWPSTKQYQSVGFAYMRESFFLGMWVLRKLTLMAAILSQ